MATKTWKIEKDLCRCCHAEGTFDNLAEPRIFLEKEEIYSDMLRECLDIDIPPVPGELCAITYTICSTCITRLRDACNFKKQVQDCEQRFMTLYYKNAIQGIKPETIVKEEFDVTIEDGNSEGDIECIVKKEDDDDDDDDDDDVGITGAGDDDDDSDDYCIKRTRSSTKATPKATPKAKPKAKPKAPVKKEKPSPQAKKKPEPKAVKEKKGADQIVEKRKFVFRPEDYRKDGDLYVCNLCDRKYSDLRRLKNHLRQVHYAFHCPFCIEKLKTNTALKLHKLEAHGVDDRSECKACKKKFNTQDQLNRHMDVYHKLGLLHKCPICEYEGYTYSYLKRHMVTHKKQKDHQCTFCKKAFLRKNTLRFHERIHTGDKRKVCKVCGEKFVQKASLNYHMAKYHPEVDF